MTISFRPLIRGLSISSHPANRSRVLYLGFRPLIRGLSISSFDPNAGKRLEIRFRPLIRGLSISSTDARIGGIVSIVSVPSSGDYQFLLDYVFWDYCTEEFPSPHPGIINFFADSPSPSAEGAQVSVPSSGDYQFLHSVRSGGFLPMLFPSPHPGIINFFSSWRERR